jgi:hypothetical protein
MRFVGVHVPFGFGGAGLDFGMARNGWILDVGFGRENYEQIPVEGREIGVGAEAEGWRNTSSPDSDLGKEV